jgi:hypothetical protein
VSAGQELFDPWAIIGALEQHRVNYVLIGALARVLHGTDEITSGVDICPQMKTENVERLETALLEFDGRVARRRPLNLDLAQLSAQEITTIRSSAGEVRIVPEPAGSSGWDDLRRASTREHLGRGVRVSVASVNDLARLMTSLSRRGDAERLAVLRRIAEIDQRRALSR